MKKITKQTFVNNYKKLDTIKRMTKFNLKNYNNVHIYYYDGFVYYREIDFYRNNSDICLKFNGIDEFIDFVINNNNINYEVVNNKNHIYFGCLEHPEYQCNRFSFDLVRNEFTNCLL